MSQWDGKTKGTVFGYRVFLFAIRVFGVGVAYMILRSVTYYYYHFAKEGRQAIEQFYQQALSYTPQQATKLARTNFYIFGQTLVDRVAFLVGRGDTYSFEFNNEKYLHQMRDMGKGGVLISGHIGNWETAGNLLKDRVSSTVNVVMYEAEAQKVTQFLEATTGGSRFNIIAIKDDLSHVIKINNALSNNEFVAIHADRYLEGAKYMELDFLGKKAKFPLGPFLIASKFKAPFSFVFSLKEGKYHYKLNATEPCTDKMEPEDIAKLYVKHMEENVKEHPEQWFNYFDFYK